ncbi:hypothetical protein AX15_006754 [Amanita polypyramis BW_CC]|nr:hypothetical protein AX15_006754 [Amanita polypyramis BW_CC]
MITGDIADDTAPLPPLRNPSPLFTGRHSYLERLKNYFSPHAGSMAPLTRKSFLLYGMGGVGKTQICLKFIEETKDW